MTSEVIAALPAPGDAGSLPGVSMFERPSPLRLRLLVLLTVGHTVITAIALAVYGPVGFLLGLLDWVTAQVFSDLVVALVLVSGWLLADARRRGERGWPWVAASLLVGSFAPLTYLLLRERALLRASGPATVV